MDWSIHLYALIVKELLSMLKDPRSRLMLLLPPLFQILVFGYAATYDLRNVPYALCDQDRSPASRMLVARFEGSKIFERVAELPNVEAFPSAIDGGKARIILHIPSDFERTLLQGKLSPIQVLADGRNSNTAGTALQYATGIVGTFNEAWAKDHGAPGPLVRTVHRAWYNPALESRWNTVPGLLAMIALVEMLILTSLSVAREREQGTLDQLIVTPLRPWEVMAGKAIPSVIIGLVQATSILLVTLFWFKIPLAGSLLSLSGAVLLFIFAAVSVGLLISVVARTMQQAMLGAFMVIMPFSLLSGLMTPMKSLPQWLQSLMVINPLRWGLVIVHRIFLEGSSLAHLWPQAVPLILIGSMAMALAAWHFRHRLG